MKIITCRRDESSRTMRPISSISVLLAMAVWLGAEGCVVPPRFVHETVSLVEPAEMPVHMARRNDLFELSDCRLTFDLAAIPEEIGIPLTVYNAFDLDAKAQSKSALCPIRDVLQKVLQDGTSAIFRGGTSVGETRVVLVPITLGITKEGGSTRTLISVSCTIGGLDCGKLSSEKTSEWPNTAQVPRSVYDAAADIGNQFLAAIANSRHLRDQILGMQKGGGTMPSIVKWQFTDILEGTFSGKAIVNCGSWDKARVLLWVRSQIEQTAMAKLGLQSLDNYRVLLDNEMDSASSGRFIQAFRVFPYQGFEITYNARTRQGKCSADLGFLGISAEDAYERARAYVTMILADQGVVLKEGQVAQPAEFQFHGFRLLSNGASIEIPFELVN